MTDAVAQIVVQRIRVEWTKVSRGAPGATRRARVPVALPLPSDFRPERLVLHDMRAVEEEAFALVTAVPGPSNRRAEPEAHGPTTGHFEPISWRVNRAQLIVDLAPSGLSAPRRPYSRAFVLSPGEWGRVLFNERFGADREWRYVHTVVNLAFRVTWSAELFTHSTPARVFDGRARLR